VTQAAPGISVLIHTHNQEAEIEAAVASVLAQTQPAQEIVIMDNGSIDGTACRAAALCERHPQVSLSLQTQRSFGDMANRLMQRAGGSLFAFMSGADRFHPDKLQQQVQALAANPRLGGVYTHVAYMSAQGQVQRGYTPHYNYVEPQDAPDPLALPRRLLLNNDAVSFSSLLLQRRAVEQVGFFDVTLQAGCAYDYALRLACRVDIQVLEQPLTLLGLRGLGCDAAADKVLAKESWQLLGKHSPKLLQRYPQLGSSLEGLYDQLTAYAYQAADYSAAEKYLRAKRLKFGLTQTDLICLLDCLVHQMSFKQANDVLEQVFPNRAQFTPHTQALLGELVARVVAFGNRSMDPFEAGRGIGGPQGLFTLHRLTDSAA
jgi:glycosyltransferase involved in cell wall biosynthesis